MTITTFSSLPTASNTEHIQVCESGSDQERRHLAVRDFLREHPDEQAAYERTKRDAAHLAGGVREKYSAAKNDYVQSLQTRALAWWDSSRTDAPL